jgi:hypothetical protein
MEREHVVRAEIQDGRRVEVEVLSKAVRRGRGGLPRAQKLFVGRTATQTVRRMASQALKTGRSKSRTRASLSRAGIMPRGELRRILNALWRSAEKGSKKVEKAVGITPTGKVVWRDPSKSEFFKGWTIEDHRGAAETWRDQGEEGLSKGHEKVADDMAEDKRERWFKAREAAWINYQAQVLLGNLEKAEPKGTFGKPRLTRADKEKIIAAHGMHRQPLESLRSQHKEFQDALTAKQAGHGHTMVSRDWMKTLKHAIDTHPSNTKKLAAPAKPRRAKAARTKPRRK